MIEKRPSENLPISLQEKSEEDLNRRDFVSQVTGYALSMYPVSGLAITTSSDGLTSEWTSIVTSDQKKMSVYRSFPKNGPSKGNILVIQEIFGLHTYIQDVCRRLAKEGYCAYAPDLYFRQGDATKLTSIDAIRENIVSKVSQSQVLKDLDATREQQIKDFPSPSFFVTGFCWGGTMTWLYSHHQPKVKAGVAWYGRIKLDKTSLVQLDPLDIAAQLKVPVLGLYGEADKGIPLDQVAEMNQKLAKAGLTPSTIKIFKKADHGFHADYRPSYAPEAAKEAWKDMLSWFDKYS